MENKNMERPKLKIKLEPIDKGIEWIGILGLVILTGLPIYFFDQLPETIPRHFGANGEPDAFSGKGIIWTLPIIGFTMFIGLYWLNKYPHIFNYPQKVTKENARRLYTTGTRMIRTLNALITWLFAYITYSTIQVALGNQSGLGTWFLPIFMISTLGTTAYFLYRSMKKDPQTAKNN
ncbi:MAG: DUF1648 domain-containing protein [Robiginitalea sp.]|jgi:uncharacterized membrane protein|uniref:DUF1648 domain-containing protein n=1 Tax=Robiginitalea sp. TaxID=1902411 RepID=UPI003C724664